MTMRVQRGLDHWRCICGRFHYALAGRIQCRCGQYWTSVSVSPQCFEGYDEAMVEQQQRLDQDNAQRYQELIARDAANGMLFEAGRSRKDWRAMAWRTDVHELAVARTVDRVLAASRVA